MTNKVPQVTFAFTTTVGTTHVPDYLTRTAGLGYLWQRWLVEDKKWTKENRTSLQRYRR